MAKSKKNTLSDLNDFLKHNSQDQKSTEEKKEYLKSSPHTIAEVNFLKEDLDKQENMTEKVIIDKIAEIAAIKKESFSQVLRRIIITAYESKKDVNATDIMLLNTALYLDHTEQLNRGFQELMDNKKK